MGCQLCNKVCHLLKGWLHVLCNATSAYFMVDVVHPQDVVQKSDCNTKNDHGWQPLLAAGKDRFRTW